LVENDPFVSWFETLERRHLSNLTFAEVRRSVQTLSSLYVERRGRLKTGSALSGAGKRAAFALFFGPLHFLLVREIVRSLSASIPSSSRILDLGCGTGSAGAAWALEIKRDPDVIGVDLNSWALEECRWNYRQLGIHGTTKKAELGALRIPANAAVVAAFTLNELEPEQRSHLLAEFLEVRKRSNPVLIVEPIARKLTSWWDDWAERIRATGGREDEWRFRVPLPERLALMDRGAGLDHRELTGRSLWLPNTP
jgi:SAM-dependent methyltransferase